MGNGRCSVLKVKKMADHSEGMSSRTVVILRIEPKYYIATQRDVRMKKGQQDHQRIKLIRQQTPTRLNLTSTGLRSAYLTKNPEVHVPLLPLHSCLDSHLPTSLAGPV